MLDTSAGIELGFICCVCVWREGRVVQAHTCILVCMPLHAHRGQRSWVSCSVMIPTRQGLSLELGWRPAILLQSPLPTALSSRCPCVHMPTSVSCCQDLCPHACAASAVTQRAITSAPRIRDGELSNPDFCRNFISCLQAKCPRAGISLPLFPRVQRENKDPYRMPVRL